MRAGLRGAPALSVALFVTQLVATHPAGAETVEELKAQLAQREAELAAQVQMNALQRQRIQTLEAELAGRKIAAAPTSKHSPQRAPDDLEDEGALERALQRRGTAVLPAYTGSTHEMEKIAR